MVNRVASGFDFGEPLRRTLANGDFIPECAVEGLSVLHVVECDFERFLRLAHGLGAEDQPFVLKFCMIA